MKLVGTELYQSVAPFFEENRKKITLISRVCTLNGHPPLVDLDVIQGTASRIMSWVSITGMNLFAAINWEIVFK